MGFKFAESRKWVSEISVRVLECSNNFPSNQEMISILQQNHKVIRQWVLFSHIFYDKINRIRNSKRTSVFSKWLTSRDAIALQQLQRKLDCCWYGCPEKTKMHISIISPNCQSQLPIIVPASKRFYPFWQDAVVTLITILERDPVSSTPLRK